MKVPAFGRTLILLTLLSGFSTAPAWPQGLMDQALQVADKVQGYYLELHKEILQESRDLDHMPPPRDTGAGNIGPGPIAYVERSFQGTDLKRRIFLRDTWMAEARDLDARLRKAEADLRARLARLAGKTRDVANVDEDGNVQYTFSDPTLARIDQEIAGLGERVQELARKERALLDRVAVANPIVQAERQKARAFTAHPFNGVWKTTWGRLTLKIDEEGAVDGTYSYKTGTGRTVRGTMKGRLLGDVIQVSRWTETVPGEFAAGTGQMTLQPGGKRFVGQFQTTEGNTGSGEWSGDKVK